MSPTGKVNSSNILWDGKILITDARSGWDLDVAPPNSQSSQQDLQATDSILIVSKDGETGFYDATMAPAPEGLQTTEPDCKNALRTKAIRSLAVSAGNSFCLGTGSDRVALVTARSVPGPLDSTLHITVWKDTDGV